MVDFSYILYFLEFSSLVEGIVGLSKCVNMLLVCILCHFQSYFRLLSLASSGAFAPADPIVSLPLLTYFLPPFYLHIKPCLSSSQNTQHKRNQTTVNEVGLSCASLYIMLLTLLTNGTKDCMLCACVIERLLAYTVNIIGDKQADSIVYFHNLC